MSYERADAVYQAAKKAVAGFGGCLHLKALLIYTPFPRRKKLGEMQLDKNLLEFIERYEPKVKEEGLYLHQARLLEQYTSNPDMNYILTTATGSGKSLCFWAWVFNQLLSNPQSTALLCFPTQSLMYSQAERMRLISEEGSVALRNDNAYGGVVQVGGDRIGWTVWKGTGGESTRDIDMQAHAKTDTFKQARIRIATLDKAHYSLLWDKSFTSRLSCIVLDEAHMYDGLFGANVMYFFKRIRLAKRLLRQHLPRFFLASATLGEAKDLAAKLISVSDSTQITHIQDEVEQDLQLVPVTEALKVLSAPPSDCLTKVALFLDEEKGNCPLVPFISDPASLGSNTNAIFFVDSKFFSRCLAREIRAEYKEKREVDLYDADLPPQKRRELEKLLNQQKRCGVTLLATSAMELGVDIEGLDVCVIDQMPNRRQDFLQRIGRIGRRKGIPGLILVKADASPMGRMLLEDPVAFFTLDTTKASPIPDYLEMLRMQHMLAGFNEGLYRDYANDDNKIFDPAMEAEFGETVRFSRLKEQFHEEFGELVDMEGRFWAHNGFRATASRGKIPLIEMEGSDGGKTRREKDRDSGKDVAWIESFDLFRDAHPEGVYLGHDGRRWRICAYEGDWAVARLKPAGKDITLAKWLKIIQEVYVEEEKREVATRGTWDQEYEFYEVAGLPELAKRPRKGRFQYGLYDYKRTWTGYSELDLSKNTATLVTLEEVSERFKQAMDEGKSFPYLHCLTYRTIGWEWQIEQPEHNENLDLALLEHIVEGLIDMFISNILQCNPKDIYAKFSLVNSKLSIFESTPGGNGLATALLMDDRFPQALSDCLSTIRNFTSSTQRQAYRRYLANNLNLSANIEPQEVIDVIERFYRNW